MQRYAEKISVIWNLVRLRKGSFCDEKKAIAKLGLSPDDQKLSFVFTEVFGEHNNVQSHLSLLVSKRTCQPNSVWRVCLFGGRIGDAFASPRHLHLRTDLCHLILPEWVQSERSHTTLARGQSHFASSICLAVIELVSRPRPPLSGLCTELPAILAVCPGRGRKRSVPLMLSRKCETR